MIEEHAKNKPVIEGQHFEHDYVLFDEFGLDKMLCQRCGSQIGGRTYAEVRSRIDPLKTEKAMVFIRHANYCTKEVVLSDKSVLHIQKCIDCAGDRVDLDKAMAQVKRGWMKENIHAGHSDSQLTDHHERVKDLKAVHDTGKVHIPWKRRNPNGLR